MIIAVDVDDTIAQSIKQWLTFYRADHNHELYQEHITDWDISQFVVPECGRDIYKYLSRADYYNDIEPIDGAWEGVEALREAGHRVVFATSTSAYDNGRKFEWLQYRGFLDGSRESEQDYLEVRDKGLIRADVLVDDYTGNLKRFKGFRILFDRPHNRETMNYYEWRASSWDSVITAVEYYEQSIRW